jgi:hypothetical protein
MSALEAGAGRTLRLGFHEILEHCLLLYDRAMSSEDFKVALVSYREKRAPV